MRWLLLLTASASFVIYGHAIQTFFSREHGVDRRMKLLQATGTLCALIHLGAVWATMDARLVQSLSALCLYAAGLAVFFAARHAVSDRSLTLAFSPDQPERLLQGGIYARIRHPFYTAYMLTWLAGLAAAPSGWTGATVFGMCLGYWYAAKLEERKFAQSPLAAAYSEYRSRAGMFWP